MTESIQIYIIDQMCLSGCQYQLETADKKSQSYFRLLWEIDSTKNKTLKDFLEIHLTVSPWILQHLLLHLMVITTAKKFPNPYQYTVTQYTVSPQSILYNRTNNLQPLLYYIIYLYLYTHTLIQRSLL